MTKYVVNAGWSHVPHISAEQQTEQLALIQPFQREARSQGIPQLGAGAIYPVPEDAVLCDPFQIPDYFPQCYALDVGWKRTAALWAAIDPNTDIVYLYSEHYRGEAEPPVHANTIRSRGPWIPGVFDPAARHRAQRDGESLLRVYQELGLETLTASANDLEAGIYECWIRLSTGRMKAFRTCTNWLAEFRFYQRDEKGRIKDGQNDHLMDTMRYVVLSGLKRAIVRPASMWRHSGARPIHESDYDSLAYPKR